MDLRMVAEAAGVKVDRRWSEATLRRKIVKACGLDRPEPELLGEVSVAVCRAVESLRLRPGLDEVGEARAALAVRLGCDLDGGEASPRDVPQLVKELRACLTDLAGEVRGDDDALRRLVAGLSSPVQHTSN